jgi:phosphoribosylamine-glycine ligase
VYVFHAATRRAEGEWIVRGGRAAYLTAVDASLDGARQRAQAALGRLTGHGWRARRDIAAGAAHHAGRS